MAIQEHSAGAVIFRNEPGKKLYLLLHYESGHWDFAKGHVEKGETIEQTIRRECEEETGIRDLEFIDGFSEKVRYKYQRDGRLTDKDVVFLLAETKTKEIRLSHEHIGFAWLPFSEAVEKTTYKKSKDVLKKAERLMGQKEG